MPEKEDEVGEVIRELKKNKGFGGYVIMNNDGIVIRHEQMDYKGAVHHAYLVLDLCAKARECIRSFFDSPDNELESLRLKTDFFEMIISQHAKFTLVVIQTDEVEQEEAKEGEEGEKKAD